MSIDVYYFPASAPARCVLLLAKYLDVPLNVINYNLMAGEHMNPEFLKINPQHTVPTMVDDGFVLTESRAILMYLQNKYGKDESLYPKDPKSKAIVDMRIFFDVSTLSVRFSESYFAAMRAKEAVDPAKVEKLNEALGFIESFLKDGFIAGNKLTIADFSVIPLLSTLPVIGHDLSKFPKITEYLDKCKKLMTGWEEINEPGLEMIKQFWNATRP